jgi:hypothetical protein
MGGCLFRLGRAQCRERQCESRLRDSRLSLSPCARRAWGRREGAVMTFMIRGVGTGHGRKGDENGIIATFRRAADGDSR